MDLAPHRDALRQLTRTDPDPHVRHRADGLMLVANGLSLTDAARRCGCARTACTPGASASSPHGEIGWLIEDGGDDRQNSTPRPATWWRPLWRRRPSTTTTRSQSGRSPM